MICWNRFISYIYRYHNNEKCGNTGFAKVQKISDNGRIQIGLKDIVERKDAVYLVYIYRETLASDDADHETVIPKLQLLGELNMRGGRGEGTFSFDWNNVMGTGKPMTAWSGILIGQEESDESGYMKSHDIFCSSWTDNHVDYSKAFEEDIEVHSEEIFSSNEQVASASSEINFKIPEFLDTLNTDVKNIETALEMEEAVSSADIVQEQNVVHETEEENTNNETTTDDNAAEEILATHEKLPLLPAYDSVSGMDAEIFECVKITPNDIGLLDMENWRLGVNSFLTHGFYHYQYLMFGKVVFREGETSRSYILGVPGIYSSKEKYLADIFGFDRFVPCQETMVKTGSFGYWIVDIKN